MIDNKFLYNFHPWIGLIGVVLGFGLGEGGRYILYRWKLHRKKEIINLELRIILHQLSQKISIINQAVKNLEEKRLMPIYSVKFETTGYHSVINSLIPHLTAKERSCLYYIYEYLRVTDIVLDTFEEKFIHYGINNIVQDPYIIFINRLKEFSELCQRNKYIIRSYLEGNPIDVLELSVTIKRAE
ncbi:hypothetical protein HHS34_000325 [Acidithiobacillus montserratensis]|uniref:Uncharacterized protein n=1 Tax=Acidithiobacillus montserratensis TaxID=2729135 RepID=A0ACD5HH87_9PROT|nr:hypothetical protein [Acidithiobacillus montserratensis]MBN2680352.1 hypothetical protein [Acidithiobacillaceae bacterium]MBU2748711.1 hypothetical protein [Acidithiobacillus montserratensis]